MACRFEITATGGDEQFVEDVVTAALTEVARLDDILSAFNPTSEVSFLNAEGASRPVVVDPDLFRLLKTAKKVWEETGGAFDTAAGQLIKLWRQAEQTEQEPEQEAVTAALEKSGMSHVHLDDLANAVYFDTPGIEINLGAIGKGFAVQRAAEILVDYQIESAFISAGGSTVFAAGVNPGEEAWHVGIRHPSKLDERVTVVTLRDKALSTSGGVQQRDPEVQERFEHIIDPVSGAQAAPAVVSATVVAADAALADALSTAFYLKGRELAEPYAASHPEVEVFLVERDGTEGEFCVTRFGGGVAND